MNINWINDLSGVGEAAEAVATEKAARGNKKDFKRVPDGKHQFLILSVAPNADKPMFQVRVRVESFEDRVLSKSFYFGGDIKIPLSELHNVGLHPKTNAEIVEAMNSLPGLRVGGKIVTKEGKTFSDIYFNYLIERDSSFVPEAAVGTDLDFDFGANAG